jgi:hypothetical protein
MKHIVFFEDTLFYLYLFSLSNEENWVGGNLDTQYGVISQFTSENYKFSLLRDTDVETFNSFNDVDMIIIDVWWYGYPNDSWFILNENILIPSVQNNIDILAFNWVGEIHGGSEKIQFQNFKKDLLKHKNLYFITHDNQKNIAGEKSLLNQTYLPILYYYYNLYDNIFLHPPIPDFKNQNKQYDFQTYLGIHNDKVDKRKDILDKINFGNKTLNISRTFNDNLTNLTKKISTIHHNLPHYGGGSNHGMYNWYSLIESETAKIRIVFETFYENIKGAEETNTFNSFLTEKTLKCLLHNQPYFLLISSYHKNLLRKLGFDFPGPDSYSDALDYISKVCEGDIEEWISLNSDLFKNNKKRMYELPFDSTLPHVKFFKNIIK